MTNLNYDPYEELANAIILQAMDDYKRGLKKILKFKYNSNKDGTVDARYDKEVTGAHYEVDTLEKYFRSGQYKLLTSVDGEYIINTVRSQVVKSEFKDVDTVKDVMANVEYLGKKFKSELYIYLKSMIGEYLKRKTE